MHMFQFQWITLSTIGLCVSMQMHAQPVASDSAFHPYHVNRWVTGALLGAGATANYLGLSMIGHKKDVTLLEMQALDKNVVNSFDRWVLEQDPAKRNTYGTYSDYVLMTSVALPGLLLFDKHIRRDWEDVLLMYLETMSLAPNLYEWSFFGPGFLDRYRPETYYEQVPFDERKSGNNRNSFYSGHVASVAASTFFLAKVYCDYNPGIGDNKYLVYGAATLPPLLLGWLRMKALKHYPSDIIVGIGIGALCGVLVPEFHRRLDKNITLSVISSDQGSGIAVIWQPDFLK